MKTYPGLAGAALAAFLSTGLPASAQQAAPEPAEEAAPTPAATNAHLQLCSMLGIRVGGRYEFQLGGGELHYWEVRSLGANGWILAKDSRFNATWVNLSQVISVTNIPKPNAPRPEKPNRRD